MIGSNMLMIIFGAGASYDSAASKRAPGTPDLRDFPDRPPLADYLFHPQDEFAQIAQHYPPMLSVIDRLRSRDSSVEAKLQHFRDEADSYPERYRQLAAVKFYLRDVLTWCSNNWNARVRGATNLGPLLDDVKRRHAKRSMTEKVCLVTFNYDFLLESALNAMGEGFGLSEVDDYVGSKSIFNLFKLHGSVNWFRLTGTHTHDRAPGATQVIEHAAQLKMADVIVGEGEATRLRQTGSWLLPAIAIPVQTKGVFECPSSHIEELQAMIPNVTELLVVGWKGREAHFISMLSQGSKKGRKIHGD